MGGDLGVNVFIEVDLSLVHFSHFLLGLEQVEGQ